MRDSDKFRGFAVGRGDETITMSKETARGKWVYGTYFCVESEKGEEVHGILSRDQVETKFVIDKRTLGRCTSISDSDHKLIYEGDIIRCDEEQAVMAITWNENCAYFELRIIYKNNAPKASGSDALSFRCFLEKNKRFSVIGTLVTPMAQLSILLPDFKSKNNAVSGRESESMTKTPEVHAGPEILTNPAFTSPGLSPVAVKPPGSMQIKSHLVMIECSTYMASDLPLIKEHLKKRVSEIMQKNSELSLVWFSGEDESDMFVERFEISDDSDYKYLSKRIDQCLKPVGKTALANPLQRIAGFAGFYDLSPSVLLVTSGNIAPHDEVYVHKTIRNLTHCAEKITLVGYGTGCNRKVLGEMANEMTANEIKATLVYCETFDNYVPEIEKFLSDGRLAGKVAGGQKALAMPDAVKKPVVAIPVKHVTPPPGAIRVEIPLEKYLSACKLLMRKALAKKRNMVIFSAKDSQFVMEWSNVGSILPANGVWPESVSIRGNCFCGFAEVPPRQDPVVLEIKGDRLWVDGLSCDCIVKGNSQILSCSK